MRELRSLALIFAIGLLPHAAHAQADASTATAKPTDAGAASNTNAKLDSGTPKDDPHAGMENPHAGAQHPAATALDGMQGHQDSVEEDPSLPAGSIEVEIRDATARPRPKTPVTLGIIQSSVAKGESRQQRVGMTDERGRIRWDNLQGGSAMSYRVSVNEAGGQFAAAPFQLDPAKGTRVVLHTYPVTSDISSTMVVMQSIVYVELKDDRVQVQQAFQIFNFGRIAWAPSDFVLPLPTGFSALTSSQSMSDQAVDTADGRGARWRGTFGPGRHTVEYRWQAPFSGEKELELGIGMPPNVAAARVMVVASQDMKVSIDGFPPVRAARDGQGNNIVETERDFRREESPFRTLRIALKDIPGPGPGRFVASGLAALVALLGYVYSRREGDENAKKKPDHRQERAALLAELEELERARKSGEIGPRTYENARRELIDALARVLATDAAPKSS